MQRDLVGNFHHQPRRVVGDLLGEPVHMEAADAGDVDTEIVLPARAESAGTAGQRSERHDAVARHDCFDAVADRDDLTGGLGADGQRQLPLGERLAAKAPHVDVVQPDAAHTQSYFARAGRRRFVALHHRDFSVGEQLQGAHHGHDPVSLSYAIMARK